MRKSQRTVKILSNRQVAPGHFRLAFSCPSLAAAAPGQFLMVKITEFAPLLRRPFGIHRARQGQVEILYERVGKGTLLLSRKQPGDQLDIIAPLGKGFSAGAYSRRGILVAGGMGVAPLLFLAQKMKAPASSGKPLALIGARTKASVLCVKDFRDLGFEVRIATDDGTRGFHGYVTRLLEEECRRAGRQAVEVFGCGPRPMLKEIFRISKAWGVPAQVSLEEHMSCGIGACQGCVVNTVGGYKRVCQDGPVFDANDIIW